MCSLVVHIFIKLQKPFFSAANKKKETHFRVCQLRLTEIKYLGVDIPFCGLDAVAFFALRLFQFKELKKQLANIEPVVTIAIYRQTSCNSNCMDDWKRKCNGTIEKCLQTTKKKKTTRCWKLYDVVERENARFWQSFFCCCLQTGEMEWEGR